MLMRHLLDTTDLTLEEIDNMIAVAMDIIDNKEKLINVSYNQKNSKNK